MPSSLSMIRDCTSCIEWWFDTVNIALTSSVYDLSMAGILDGKICAKRLVQCF